MKFSIKRFSGAFLATVLMMDGFVHLYWSTGNTWPASNTEMLSLVVLNMNVSFGPSVVIPLAFLLFTAAVIVLTKIQLLGRISNRIPQWFVNLTLLALSIGLMLRSLVGIVWIFGIGADTQTLFYTLNLFAYTPVCIVLFIASILTLSIKTTKTAV